MVDRQDDAPKRAGLLDEIDRTRFVTRRTPEWGEQAAALLWKRQQDLRMLIVVVSLTFIVAILTNSGVAMAAAIACGSAISLLLAVRVHTLQKKALRLRR